MLNPRDGGVIFSQFLLYVFKRAIFPRDSEGVGLIVGFKLANRNVELTVSQINSLFQIVY